MDVFNTFVATIEREIINPLITVIALGAFLIFVYGIFEYVKNGEDDTKRKTGQQHMLWGVIGLAIIFSASAMLQIVKKFALE